jgi:ABC-type uncharacterized transport system substrate-binding protein
MTPGVRTAERRALATRIKSVVLAIGAVAALLAVPAGAEVTQTDMLVAGRAIGFIDNLKRGDVRVGIVYDPGIAQSSQQAAELGTLLNNGLRIGSLTLRPVMLPAGKSDNGGIDLFFLTEGAGSMAAKVGRASRERKIPCITFDLNQVRNGTCAIGVRSQPRIEVFVNRAAAEASGIELAAVFRMMITEI